MRTLDHYINDINVEYILNAEYDENGDRFNLTIKKIFADGDNAVIQRINLNDVAVRSILSLYQQLKFKVK